jgi:hypothetical protein
MWSGSSMVPLDGHEVASLEQVVYSGDYLSLPQPVHEQIVASSFMSMVEATTQTRNTARVTS